MLQIKFGKKSVADFSKECALLLPLHKIRFAIISFFGVGRSGRRPFEYEVKKAAKESRAIRYLTDKKFSDTSVVTQ